MHTITENLDDANMLKAHYGKHVLQIFDVLNSSNETRPAGWKSETFWNAWYNGERVTKFYNFIPFPTFEIPKSDATEPERITISSNLTLNNLRKRIVDDDAIGEEQKLSLLRKLSDLIYDWVEKDKREYLRFARRQVEDGPSSYDLNLGASPNDISKAVRSGKTVGWVSLTGSRSRPTQKKLSLYTKGDGDGMVVITVGEPGRTPDTCYLFDYFANNNVLSNKIKSLIGDDKSTFKKRDEDIANYEVAYFVLSNGEITEKTHAIQGNKFIKGISEKCVDVKNLAYDFYSSRGLAAFKIIKCDKYGQAIEDEVRSTNNLAKMGEIRDILKGKIKHPSLQGCDTYESCIARVGLFKSLTSLMKSHEYDAIIDSLLSIDEKWISNIASQNKDDAKSIITALHSFKWDLSKGGFLTTIEEALSTRKLYIKSLEKSDAEAGYPYVEWEGRKYYDASEVLKLQSIIAECQASGVFRQSKDWSSDVVVPTQNILNYCNDYIGWGMLKKCPPSSPIFVPLMRRMNFFGFAELSKEYTEECYKDIKDSYSKKIDGEDVAVESLSEGMFRLNGKEYLTEASRQQLLNQSRNAKHYKDVSKGKNRYERRMKSKISATIRDYNNIEMDQLFKRDIFEIKIPVMGETDVYEVHIKINGLLTEIQKEVQSNKGVLEFKVILQSLMRTLNTGDVFVGCQCPDFCLKGDTKIKLLSGETIAVADLLDRFKASVDDLYVYSTDEKGDFKPGKIQDVWVSGYVNDMVRVLLDNGKTVETTPNHKFMLRNGEYKEAKDLSVGDSLMPLYFRLDRKGYESVKTNSEATTKFYSVYKLVANELLGEEIDEAKKRSGEVNVAIHHRDFNKLNNSPQNLFPMGVQEHYKYHAEHVRDSGCLDKFLQAGKEYWAKQESRDKQAVVMHNTMRKYYDNISREELKKIRVGKGCYSSEWKSKISKAQKDVWASYSEDEYANRVAKNIESIKRNRDKISDGIKRHYREMPADARMALNAKLAATSKRAWVTKRECFMTQKRFDSNCKKFQYERTADTERARNIHKIGNILNKIIANGDIPSPETYEKYRTNGYPKYTKYFNSWSELSEYFKLNHKIAKIEYTHYDEAIPVYDLSIGTYNNFYVDAGVILHNCYRMRYWATQNGYVAGGKETRPSDKTNPTNNLGAACKHVLLILNNLSWCLKVAAVVHNYIRYCQTHLEQEYADYIFPRIYGIKYDKAVQMNLFYDGFLPQDKRTRDEITRNSLMGRDVHGRFQPDNPYKFRKSDSRQYPEDNPNQLKLNIEGPIEKKLSGGEDETTKPSSQSLN